VKAINYIEEVMKSLPKADEEPFEVKKRRSNSAITAWNPLRRSSTDKMKK
jgi:hypothetical protein